jgi:hypothetical protein
VFFVRNFELYPKMSSNNGVSSNLTGQIRNREESDGNDLYLTPNRVNRPRFNESVGYVMPSTPSGSTSTPLNSVLVTPNAELFVPPPLPAAPSLWDDVAEVSGVAGTVSPFPRLIANDPAALALMASIGVYGVNNCGDFISNKITQWPAILNLTKRYTIIAVMMPREADSILSYQSVLNKYLMYPPGYKGSMGFFDKKMMKSFYQYRTMGAGNVYAFFECGLVLMPCLVPEGKQAPQSHAENVLLTNSDGHLILSAPNHNILMSRVCKPVTLQASAVLESDAVIDCIRQMKLPVFVFKNFILQKNSGSFIFSSQSNANMPSSSIHFLGSLTGSVSDPVFEAGPGGVSLTGVIPVV